MANQDLDGPHTENVTPPMPEMGSDSAFTATPIAPPLLAPVEEDTINANPTFIQNQISLQRAPSTPRSTANALARNLSVRSNASYRSNGSYDAGLSRSAILSVLAHSEEPVRGREPADSDSSIAESSGSCKLSKSNSDRSVKSVRSVAHIGPLPIGSLRCDSPPPRGLTYDCLKEGDVLIVAELQPGCIFTYDMKTFLVRPEDTFLGIKQIPFGSHFIWGGSDQGSSRVGFWIMASSRASNEFGEVHIRRWNKYDECLSEEVVAAELRIRTKEVPSVYEDLRPYTSDSHTLTHTAAAPRQSPHDATLWSRLTGSIKGSLLSRITGQKWNHWKISSSDDYRDRKPVVNGEPQEENGQDSVFDFVVPRQTHTWSKDSVGRDRTEQAMDTSSHIQAIISDICKYEDSDYIIGEMQFCYITGMSLGNIVCQEHWAHIVRIVFRAYRLVLVLPKFMRKIIDALHAQLIYDEIFDGSIFDHAAKLDDDLKIILTTFKSRLTEQLLAQGNYLTDEQSAVGKAFEELESFLWKWNWDLRGNYVRSGQVQLEDGEFVDAELNDFEAEDERGEFAPVVVDIDEDGRERGLVRF